MKLTEAQVARLRSLETDGRRLTTSAVIKDAQKKTSPLHKLFPWDVKKAAYQHWTVIARDVIGSVTVLVETHERTIKTSLGYAKDPHQKSGYIATATMRADPITSRLSLIYTLEVAAGHLRRCYDLAAVLGMQDQIDQLLQDILGVKRTLEDKAA